MNKKGRQQLENELLKLTNTNQCLKIFKIKDVKTPERKGRNAGIDFFIPNSFNKGKDFILKKNKSILIPSGIKVKIPENYSLIAFNKSGISTKLGLQVGACVVDENYTGEVHIHLINISKNKVILFPGQKIIQFLLIKVNYVIPIEINQEKNMCWNNKERGEKGFGSTG